MCYNFNYYVLYCNPIYSLKFIVRKINYEIIKFRMVKLIMREKIDITDINVAMN
jgi:hypothetical protein